MQEVDGEALLLIKPEHLVMALSMKLGPALKIVACIDSLRPESEQTTSEQDWGTFTYLSIHFLSNIIRFKACVGAFL